MYCDDTANARIDLSCFIRCARAGVRLPSRPDFSAPCVSRMPSLYGGAAAGMVSPAWCCVSGVSAWSRVKVSRLGGSDDGTFRVQGQKRRLRGPDASPMDAAARLDVPLSPTPRAVFTSCDVSDADKMHMVLLSAELQPARRWNGKMAEEESPALCDSGASLTVLERGSR